jgi:hypothetical protein
MTGMVYVKMTRMMEQMTSSVYLLVVYFGFCWIIIVGKWLAAHRLARLRIGCRPHFEQHTSPQHTSQPFYKGIPIGL